MFNIATIISTIIMCNIGEAVKRFLLDKEDNTYEIGTIAVIWTFVGIFLSGIVYFILYLVPYTRKFAMYICVYIFLIALNSVLSCYLRGNENVTLYACSNIGLALFIGITNVWFLKFNSLGIKGYFLAYIISYCLVNLFILVVSKFYMIIIKFKFSLQLFIQMSKFSLYVVPNSLLWWITNSSDRVMVTAIMGASENGLYAMSYKIPSMLAILSTIFIQAWEFSAVKESTENEKSDYSQKMFYNYLNFITLSSIALIILNRPLIHIFLEKSYYNSWRYSAILVFGFWFMTLGDFVGTSYYVSKKMKGNLISSFIGAVINILFNFMLIPKIGIWGAAISTTFSYFVMFIFRIYDTKKIRNFDINFKHVIINILIMLIMCFIGSCDNKYTIYYEILIFIIVCLTQKNNLQQIYLKFLRMINKE